MMEEMNYKSFWNFIKLLDDNDLLKHVVLIGSWCEYLYAQSGYLKGYSTSLRTLDIDFLVKNMRKPSEKINLSKIASDNGYTVEKDVLTGTTKIFTPDLMEVEFLIEQMGASTESVLQTNLGVNAQALHHVGILKKHSITIKIFDFEITVPSPEAYVIHKILINSQRGKKIEKDRIAIDNLMPFLDWEEMNIIMTSLYKKEKRVLDEYLERYK